MLVRFIARLRATRWANVCVVNLRVLIGFAFVPAALKKVLGERFTDATNHGAFHDFLHGFHATGNFYRFVGVMQLVAAVLLCTQRFATVGALIALPIVTAICVFCWSTGVVFTSFVVTLMAAGLVGLLVWDWQKLALVVARDDRTTSARVEPVTDRIDMHLWENCGAAIISLYVGSSIVRGGVYRPRGMEWSEPAFYVMPAVLLVPIVTFVIDQRRHSRSRRVTA